MKSKQKMNGSVPSGLQVTDGLPTEPYQIKRVFLQIELELYDPASGKVTGTRMSQPVVIFEAEFPAGLSDLFQRAGIKPTPYIPKQG